MSARIYTPERQAEIDRCDLLKRWCAMTVWGLRVADDTAAAGAARRLDHVIAVSMPEPPVSVGAFWVPNGGAVMSKLRNRLNDLHAKAIKPAADRYAAALTAVRAAEIPDEATAAAIVALEELHAAAAEAAGEMREALRDEMDEDGTLRTEAGNYEVTRVRPKPVPTVTDMAALKMAAPELFEPQPDKLNRAELAKRLHKGKTLPGVTLSNGGPGHIQIRGKK